MIEFFKGLKLTITQWLLVMAAATIGILGVILRYKEHEIGMMRITYLQQHFLLENEKSNIKIAASKEALQKSKNKLSEEINAYNNKHIDIDYNDPNDSSKQG